MSQESKQHQSIPPKKHPPMPKKDQRAMLHHPCETTIGVCECGIATNRNKIKMVQRQAARFVTASQGLYKVLQGFRRFFLWG